MHIGMQFEKFPSRKVINHLTDEVMKVFKV